MVEDVQQGVDCLRISDRYDVCGVLPHNLKVTFAWGARAKCIGDGCDRGQGGDLILAVALSHRIGADGFDAVDARQRGFDHER